MAGRGSLGGHVGGYAVRVLLLLMLLAASRAVPGLADVNATLGLWDEPATRG
jgi:hypothetical protein